MHSFLTKKKRGILLLAALVFCGVFTLRSMLLKSMYPNPAAVNVSYNTAYETAGYQLSLDKWSVMTYEDAVKRFPELEGKYPKVNDSQEPDYIICTDLVITNKDAVADSYLDLSAFNFESGSWSNGISLEPFKALNPGESMGKIQVNTGTSKILHLCSSLYKFHFSKNAWKDVLKRQFGLTLSYYPEKILLMGASDQA